MKKLKLSLFIFLMLQIVVYGEMKLQNQVLKLVNIERKKEGLEPLKIDKKLTSVAQVKSDEMEKKGYFNHKSPKYGTPFQMMDKFGIKYMVAAENIAYGQETPEKVVKGWMESPGHRKNILNSRFHEIGIGISKNEPYHWVQMFTGK